MHRWNRTPLGASHPTWSFLHWGGAAGMGWSLTQFLSPSPFPLSAEHPHTQKRSWLIGWGRHGETLKLIKRFSKAICFPLGLRFDNQTNSLPSAPHFNFYNVNFHY